MRIIKKTAVLTAAALTALMMAAAVNAKEAATPVIEEEPGTFVFEAENVDLTYLSGHGWSNEVMGAGLLIKDKYDAQASGGYALGYLYENGNEIEFYINSDKDVEDVKLILRCTMEHKNSSASLAWNEFEITVNDEDPIEYRTMTFENIPGLLTVKNELLPFSNKTIGKINLVEGENLIKLTVTNDITMEGTMQATAPIIDCIILKTDSDATFTWAEGFPMNTDYIEAN
ncbi:MAG: hypothetical protein HUJ76_01010 [Parasporobacterium sp.]|nr:hypothetical protein [Parasporobacterium sp.]